MTPVHWAFAGLCVAFLGFGVVAGAWLTFVGQESLAFTLGPVLIFVGGVIIVRVAVRPPR